MINWQYINKVLEVVYFLTVYEKIRVKNINNEEAVEMVRRSNFFIRFELFELVEKFKKLEKVHNNLVDEVMQNRDMLRKILKGFSGGMREVLK